jgi:hypothetical protein
MKMKPPADAPLMKLLHHHLWSSFASWKYTVAMVMKAVTTMTMQKARKRMPKSVYLCRGVGG